MKALIRVFFVLLTIYILTLVLEVCGMGGPAPEPDDDGKPAIRILVPDDDEDDGDADDDADADENTDAEETDENEEGPLSLMEQMIAQIADYNTVLQFEGFGTSEVVDTFALVRDEHPEFFWLSGGYSYSAQEKGGVNYVTFTPSLYVDKEKIPSMDAVFKQTVTGILQNIPNGSDYEKALYVHDYLTRICCYDYPTAELVEKSNNDPEHKFYGDMIGCTAYGCLVNHTAICQGYTFAYQVLMNRIGIPCGNTEGSAGGGLHIWNYITLDGDNYYVDVTWDDPTTKDDVNSKNDIPCHTYFCVTGDELYKDHRIGADETDPNCRGTKYNYYKLNGLYLESYDFSSVSSVITDNINSRLIEIKFSSQEQLNSAVKDLFDRNSVHNIEAVNSREHKTVWHSTSDEMCALKIWFE